MLDPKALEKAVEKQILESVDSQVSFIMANDQWLNSAENKVLKYMQDRILAKFANSEAMPEIIDAVKVSVTKLFIDGNIPGIDQFIDHEIIKQSIDQSVTELIKNSIIELTKDSVWLEKIEQMINQTVVYRTVTDLNNIDLAGIIHQRIDENMSKVKIDLLKNFASTGIDDKATQCQLTILDTSTVIENKLTANEAEVVGALVVKDLVVKGSINTDNQSWKELSNSIGIDTLKKLDQEFQKQIVESVRETIKNQGIDFSQVSIDGNLLVDKNVLSKSITISNIQEVGTLNKLRVNGEAYVNDTLAVVNKRVGINTDSPESAISIWDEEISVNIGKYKHNEAYIGTSRVQSLNIGVNKIPQIQISDNGVTTIKQLKVGQHRISHYHEVPGWSGSRGDIVFNSNPTAINNAFAWVCLGAHKWKTLKAVE